MTVDLRDLLAKGRGVAATARVLRLDGLEAPALNEPWSLDAMRGRLVELSAAGDAATLTLAIELVLAAQRLAEPAAWVTLPETVFYPQDMVESGVDLAALLVVRANDPVIAVRSAERLLRSGGFSLVVLDFGGIRDATISMANLGRLVTLAQTHEAAAVCITRKSSDELSLGSLVSLRVEALRLCGPAHDHDIALRALKDKQRGPGWTHRFKRGGGSGGF